MHPHPAFRSEDRAPLDALIDEIGFGMAFATSPDGPRVAHPPLTWAGDGAVPFHLPRGSALTRHIDSGSVLAVINGPEGYVSSRWYADAEQAPTWNYVALEMESRVRRMDSDGLLGLLEMLSTREEARISQRTPSTMAKMPEAKLLALRDRTVGFELEVQAWRPTFRPSQNKASDERERVATGFETQGSGAIAYFMRRSAP